MAFQTFDRYAMYGIASLDNRSRRHSEEGIRHYWILLGIGRFSPLDVSRATVATLIIAATASARTEVFMDER